MSTYISVILVVFVFYIFQFIYGQAVKNNGIVDIFWGFGFVIAVWVGFLINGSESTTALIVVFLVSLWGLRLGYHIYKRNHGKQEDFRYVNFRLKWGRSWVKTKAFLQVYMLQMLMLLVIVSAPLNVIIVDRQTLSVLDIIGVLIWCMGFAFETMADYELKHFKADKKNKGKILTSGLYKYTRHPNYFGEATMWWGIYIIGMNSGGALYIISPVVITYLLRYVSGVPLLEKHYENNLQYQTYADKTSIFIPMRPKK